MNEEQAKDTLNQRQRRDEPGINYWVNQERAKAYLEGLEDGRREKKHE
jgi:hypothetical protein